MEQISNTGDSQFQRMDDETRARFKVLYITGNFSLRTRRERNNSVSRLRKVSMEGRILTDCHCQPVLIKVVIDFLWLGNAVKTSS